MLFNWPYGSLHYLHLCAAKDLMQHFNFYTEWKYRLTIELKLFCFVVLSVDWPSLGIFVF